MASRAARPKLPVLEIDPDDEEQLSKVVEAIAALVLGSESRRHSKERSSPAPAKSRAKPSKPTKRKTRAAKRAKRRR